MDRELTRALKDEALRLGFDQVGVAPAVAPPGYPRFLEWLTAGHAAGMTYLEASRELRSHPDRLFAAVRSVVVVSRVYGQADDTPPGPLEGKVARYARGADYHELMWRPLEALLGWLRRRHPEVQGRALADSAPVLERDLARLAGIGWIGKNTMLIDRRVGSFTVLGTLLVDLELEPDPPHESSHCGTCTRCLDACPTDAFVGPYQLDARRCIGYWTVEHRGPIDEEFVDRLDGWVFGCDVCQDVCPWNRKAPPGRTPQLDATPELSNPDLLGWLTRDPAEFAKWLKTTPLQRARRSGILRNAALVLGGRGATAAPAVPALAACLADDDPTVRSAAEWALRGIGTPDAWLALTSSGRDAQEENTRTRGWSFGPPRGA